jgi:hypothetical protein
LKTLFQTFSRQKFSRQKLFLFHPSRQNRFVLKDPFRLPISITKIGHRSDFNPLKSVTCPISAGRECSIEIGLVANLKIKNLEIVN